MTQTEIIQAFKATGMIPVFYHQDADTVKKIIDIFYSEGVRLFEFTNRGENALTTFKLLKKHAEQYSDFLLGIGTMMDDDTTRRFIDARADFIVSPIIKESMGRVCHEASKFWIPGCGTVTEVVRAKEAGAELIKVFPGSVLGPDFISSVLPILPGIKLMPTGGVDTSRESLEAWFKSGAVCVGMGSQLLDKKLIATQNWTQLRIKVAETMRTVQEIVSPKSKTIIPIL